MARFIDARLVNDPFGDPAVLLDFRFRRRAILFDLGDVAALGASELLRVSHVFVSHTHVDHFAGFDRLLRFRLKADLPLHLVGPDCFIDRVEAKLQAYTWNLLDETAPDFVVTASEFVGGRVQRQSRFQARQRFARGSAEPPGLAPGLVLDESDVTVRAAILDHGTDCLAFALVERQRVTVLKAGLDRLGLPVGPWISAAKQAIRSGLDGATPIAVGEGRSIRLAILQDHAMTTAPGQTVGYVVDAADHAENQDRIETLVRGVDQLFIEAAFADEDGELARARHHMTAGGAGRIARRAGVKTVVPLHMSRRYAGDAPRLAAQLDAAFRPC